MYPNGEDHGTPIPFAPRPALGVSLAAALALSVLWWLPLEQRRAYPTAGLSVEVALAAVPVTAMDMTAAPAVTSPTATIARFSVTPLEAVAATVEVQRTHEILLTRYGSLHGP